MWWGFENGMGWWMLLEALFWIGIVVAGVWLAATWLQRYEASGLVPLDLAKRRYARGEITREEFDRIRADLQNE